MQESLSVCGRRVCGGGDPGTKSPRRAHPSGRAGPEAAWQCRRVFQDKYFIHHGLDTTLVGLVTVGVQITVNTPLIHWFYVFSFALFSHF